METILGLEQESLARLAEQLQPLWLRPGQKLYDFADLPPGIALIAEGQMRLLALDEEKNLYLRRLKAGDQCGEVGLLEV